MSLFKLLTLMVFSFNLVYAMVELCYQPVVVYMSPYLSVVDFFKLTELNKKHFLAYSNHPIRQARITIISPYIDQDRVYLKYFLDRQTISSDATLTIDIRTQNKSYYESVLLILSKHFAYNKIDTIYFLNRFCEPLNVNVNRYFSSKAMRENQEFELHMRDILETTQQFINSNANSFTHIKMTGFPDLLKEEVKKNNFENYNVNFLD